MSDFIEPQSTPVDSVIPPIQKFVNSLLVLEQLHLKQIKREYLLEPIIFTDAPWKLKLYRVNTIGPNGEILGDGPNGTITTNHIKDATYGLKRVFCYTTYINKYCRNLVVS